MTNKKTEPTQVPATPSPQPAAGETCRECNGLGYIGDNEAGAPECECPTCGGTGKQPPAAPDAGVREFIAAAQKLSGYVAADLSANREQVGTVWYKDMLDAVRSVTKHSPDLTRQLAAERQGREKAEASKEFTDRWYACRIRWLEDFFRGEGRELPIAKQFWNIIANGTPDHVAPPTYQQLLNTVTHRAEAAERDLATVRQQLAEAEAFIARQGYRRCDVAACNCGSWHGGTTEQRLTEIRDALAEAGFEPMRDTILGALQKALAELTKLRSQVVPGPETLGELIVGDNERLLTNGTYAYAKQDWLSWGCMLVTSNGRTADRGWFYIKLPLPSSIRLPDVKGGEG